MGLRPLPKVRAHQQLKVAEVLRRLSIHLADAGGNDVDLSFRMPRQQQKEQAQLNELLDNLKKNDEVERRAV